MNPRVETPPIVPFALHSSFPPLCGLPLIRYHHEHHYKGSQQPGSTSNSRRINGVTAVKKGKMNWDYHTTHMFLEEIGVRDSHKFDVTHIQLDFDRACSRSLRKAQTGFSKSELFLLAVSTRYLTSLRNVTASRWARIRRIRNQ